MKRHQIKYLLLLIIFCFTKILSAQNKFSLSGTITDSKTGEKLIGVTVYNKKNKTGTATNNKGFYTLSLPKGEHQISFSSIGYKKAAKKITLLNNTKQNIQLVPSTKKINEVKISAEAPDYNIKSTEISIEKLDIKIIKKIPVIMGETDIMKTIQLLPGITSIAEGRSGYIVRGSGIDQNLILMDDMPIYYSSHMRGLYSVFNSEAVDGLTVYKGGTPARFGGRCASVLDVRMRESGFNEYHAKLSVGLITSKFSLEAPVIKDKLSVFIAGRSTKLGFGSLYDKLTNSDNLGGGGKGNSTKGAISSESNYTFFDAYESWYDINGKIIYKINEFNNLYLSGYYGQDFGITAAGYTDWGNRAASFRWNHDFNDQFTSNTSLIHSRYYTHGNGGQYIFNSGVNTNSIKQEFSLFPNNKNNIRFGFQSEHQVFDHGSLEYTEDSFGKFMPGMQGLESAFYIENDQKITARLSALYGLRYSIYHQLGPGDVHIYDEESNESLSSVNHPGKTDIMSFYHNPEPRIALTFLINEQSSFKTSYNRNAQYMRLMTLGAEIQWYDIWLSTTSNIPPMLTDQLAAGYFRNFLDNEIRFSTEIYYKWLSNASDFEDGLHNYLIDNLEAYVATGIGKSYGFETSIEKPNGRFNGRVSYNYGNANYKIDVINKGRWYPNMFDKTHSIAAITSYEILHNLTISGTFLYSTGRPVTLPEAYYYIEGIPFPYWEGRNKYRLPNYHRLDLGIKYEPEFLAINLNKQNRKIETELEISFYNVYNRRNIYTINYGSSGGKNISTDESSSNGTESVFEPYGASTFGFMPSFQINLKF